MVESEDDIIAAGAEIIWVMEQTAANEPGTADNCYSFLSQLGSTKGWCVGDSQTQPVPYTFDNSPFSTGRGIDMVVRRSTMTIEFVADHGTPAGNDNLTGAEILAAVQAVVANTQP